MMGLSKSKTKLQYTQYGPSGVVSSKFQRIKMYFHLCMIYIPCSQITWQDTTTPGMICKSCHTAVFILIY